MTIPNMAEPNASGASGANVVPLPWSLACHSALLNVLFEALKRAVARGLVTHTDAERLMCDGAARDCAVLRASIEVVLGVLEARAQVRA